MQQAAESYRLFFALWPEAEVATHIDKSAHQALTSVTGRNIPAHQLHITLAFIGSVEAARMHCMQQAAAGLRAASFELSLDRLGYWSRPQIVWLAPTAYPPAMLQLQADLVRALTEECAYQPESRPFTPHLSLMRKVRRGPEPTSVAPIRWPVRRFSLIRSQTRPAGVEYEVLNHWPLLN